jgi:hypothetical protein
VVDQAEELKMQLFQPLLLVKETQAVQAEQIAPIGGPAVVVVQVKQERMEPSVVEEMVVQAPFGWHPSQQQWQPGSA